MTQQSPEFSPADVTPVANESCTDTAAHFPITSVEKNQIPNDPLLDVKRQLSTIIRLLARIDRKPHRLRRRAAPQLCGPLKIAQAALRANVSETTIRRAIKKSNNSDKLVAHDLSLGDGRANHRIDPADLTAWIKRRESRAAPPSVPIIHVSKGKTGHFKF